MSYIINLKQFWRAVTSKPQLLPCHSIVPLPRQFEGDLYLIIQCRVSQKDVENSLKSETQNVDEWQMQAEYALSESINRLNCKKGRVQLFQLVESLS
jgi:hypothetical protein